MTMFRLLAVFAATVIIGPNVFAAEDASDLEDVIVVDEDPAAYFERAPSSLSRRMKLTIEAACKSTAASSIFCSGARLWFLREVSELGHKTNFGYACVGVSDRNKYFAPRSVYGNSGCVAVGCEVRSKLCIVSVDDLLAAVPYYEPEYPSNRKP